MQMPSHVIGVHTPDAAALTPYEVALLNKFMHYSIDQDVDFLRYVARACTAAPDAATLAPYEASFLFRCFFPFKMFFYD